MWKRLTFIHSYLAYILLFAIQWHGCVKMYKMKIIQRIQFFLFVFYVCVCVCARCRKNQKWFSTEYESGFSIHIHFRWLYKSLTPIFALVALVILDFSSTYPSIFMSNFTFYFEKEANENHQPNQRREEKKNTNRTHENLLRHDTLWWLCDNIHIHTHTHSLWSPSH